MDPTDMPDDFGDPVRRMPPKNKSVDAMGGAGANVAIAFFVGTMMGWVDTSGLSGQDRVVIHSTNDRTPRSRSIELPTPPPRG